MTTNTTVEKWRLEVDTKKAQADMKKFEGRLNDMFDKGAMKIAVYNKALDVAVGALRGIGSWLKQGATDAALFERTTNQLVTTLRSVGDVTASWLPSLQATASEIQRLTGESDETIRSLEIMALNSGVATDQIDDLLKASVRLSNGLDINLRTAVTQLIKTKSGLVEETIKATGVLNDLTKEELKAGKAVDVVNEKLQDQLDVLTGGTAGAQMALSSAWADLGESIAKLATNAGVATGMTNLATAINDIASGMERIRDADPAAIAQGILAFMSPQAAAARFGGMLATGGDSGPADAPPDPGESFGGGTLSVGGLSVNLAKRKKARDERAARRRKGFEARSRQFQGRVAGEQESIAASFEGDDAFTADAQRYEQQMLAAEEHRNAIEELERNSALRIRDINDEMNTELQAAMNEDLKIREQKMQEMAGLVRGGVQVASGAMMGLMNDLMTGADFAAEKFAASMLTGIGTMLFQKGVGDMAAAVATGLIYGNFSGIGAASAEMAIGAGMMAGGGAVSAGVQNKEAAKAEAEKTKSAGSGSAGTTRQFSRENGNGSGGDKNVTVILQGPVYDGAAAGVAISDAIAEANRQGF